MTTAVRWLLGALVSLPAVAWGQQIEVSTFPVGYPSSHLAVAGGADGKMTFVWSEYGYGAASKDLGWARTFNADGTAVADAVRLDIGGHFENPDVAPLPGGGYITSSVYHNTNSNHDLLGRFLDAAGTPAASPFEVQLDSQNLAGGVVTAVSSGPVFFWYQDFFWSRRFGFSGQPLGIPAHVDDESSSYSFVTDIAPLPGGGYVAAWFDFSRQTTRFRLFGANGLPAGPVNETANLFFNHVAASAVGGIAVSGNYGNKLSVRRFALDGQSLGAEIVLHDSSYLGQGIADLEFDPVGDLYVIWSAQQQNIYLPIKADVLDTAGNRVGPTTVIDSSPASDLRTARLTNGFFVNAWTWGFNSTLYANVVSLCGLQLASCGNGVVDFPCEQCDDGTGNSDTQPDACRTSCKPAGCGDGVIDYLEECDDHNHANADGCDQQCLIEVCANGRVEGGEDCDDSNLVDGDGCDSNCRNTGCGNGVTTSGEECDDGNLVNSDGCDQNCLVEACGNTRLEAGEECDDGNLADGDGCDSDCTNTRCGNGIETAGEECDDGNNTNGDGCDRLCLVEECGNNRLEGDEECDDGNLVDDDGCQASCDLTPRLDAMLDPVRPVRIALSPLLPTATKKLTVAVRNIDPTGLQILRLQASAGTCPPNTIALVPDFDSRIGGTQDSVALLPGQKARARMTLQVSRGSFAAVDPTAPFRCAIELSVEPATGGVIDANPSNSHFSVDVEIFDRAAANNPAESYVQAAKPVRIRIPNGLLARDRAVRVKAGATQAGATFAFAVSDGSCPAGTATLTSQDAGGEAMVNLRAARAFFTTPNGAPQRCTAMITATSGTDTDPGNNTTPLSIDVVDDNDGG